MNMIGNIKVTDEVREHLSAHFSQEQPGSKFFCDSPESVIKTAMLQAPEKFQNALPDSDGRYRLSVIFPEPIGVSNIISLSDLTLDERERIQIVNRNGKLVRALRTDRVITTCECQFVFSSDYHLITMYPGEFAPPLPSSLEEPSEFWDNHIFIIKT